MDDEVRELLALSEVGVLATQRPGGGIRQSVVYFIADGDRVLVSSESKRTKCRDIVATGRASLAVYGAERPHSGVAVEGPARVLTEGIGELTSRLFERIFGAAPQDELSDEVLASIDRVIIEITVEHAHVARFMGKVS
jgi:predicted pyridoxine 5'-phosphate oxidase superfamily flavin-nucleotide-binding protein